MKKIIKKFDEKLIRLINGRIKTKFLDKFMLKFTFLGSAIFISLFTLALIVFGNGNIRNIGIEVAATLTISQAITYSLKSLLSRERPYNMLKNLNTFGIILKDYSFPSGHTSASFSVATIIALNIPNMAIFVMCIALLVGISRIYLGVHYPTDVLAGMILGIGVAFIVDLYLYTYILKIIQYLYI